MSLQLLITKLSGRLSLLPGKSSHEEISTEKDWICQLPDEILASILSHLSVKEAVKIRVLSRRWKHVLLPHLQASRSPIRFDFAWAGTYFSHEGYQQLAHTYVQTIYRFLNQYRGPNISLFELAFCLGGMFASDIDCWITYAIRLGVEELNISRSCTAGCSTVEQRELYPFSFQHLSEASELERLSLGYCVLKRDCNFSGQFLSLKFLNLIYTALDQSMLLFILSRCSNLEGLRLRQCLCPAVLSFRGPFLRLKSLAV